METKHIIIIIIVAAILLAVIAGLSETNQYNSTTTETTQIKDSEIEKLFTMPKGFFISNANDKILNANHDGLAQKVHLMIIKCDSYEDALNELEGNMTKSSATNIYSFTNNHGDIGYEEIVEVNGTYYVIEIYSIGDHLGSYTEHSFEDIDTAINEFNDVNHLTPI